MGKQTFCIINPHLKDLGGHYFEYTYALAKGAEAAGYNVVVMAHRDVDAEIAEKIPVRRVFDREIWQTFRFIPSKTPKNRKLSTLIENHLFYRQLNKILSPSKITSDWLIFCDMICHNQVLAWAWWFRDLPAHVQPRLTLLFRYSTDWLDYWTGEKMARQGFGILEKANSNQRLCLCSDSARLAKDYARFTSLPFQVMPIPHTQHIQAVSVPIHNEMDSLAVDYHHSQIQGTELAVPQPLRLVSLGNARDEKGFFEILAAIEILNQQNQVKRFQFVLQANRTSPEILAAIAQIQRLALDNVDFLFQDLATEDYYQLLNSAHVVLVPYWHSIYVSRTSGVFTEALAAGKPVIATQDTWMSDQLQEYGGGVLCQDRSPQSLAQAIIQVADHYQDYVNKASNSQSSWLQKHNPQALVDEIIALPMTPTTKKKRAAVLYPWGSDILTRQGGAARRTSMMIEFLKDHFSNVIVLTHGDHADQVSGNINYLFYKRPRLYAYLLKGCQFFYRYILRLLSFNRSRDEDFMLWFHLLFRLDPAFRQTIVDIVDQVDVVFLEYTFWGFVVCDVCRQRDIPVILTTYDVLSNQIIKVPWLKQMTLNQEIFALKQADKAICVSEGDQKFFSRHGVEASVIPHGIQSNISRSQHSRSYILYCLREFYGFPHVKKNICLFVGSRFDPNLVAVEKIRAIARRLSPLITGEVISFVVVGTCCEPLKDGNFVALGQVEDIVLETLYNIANLILIPLQSGTGSSVKTIEAMAYGKPILGTSVAFRGYPVQADIHCIINDNIEDYPQLILDVLHNTELQSQLGGSARKFAEEYDYRNVYRSYLDLLSSLR